MWTVAVDSDALVRFLLKNATMVERAVALLDDDEFDHLETAQVESEILRLLTKIHQSLAGMASYLKLRKENEQDGLDFQGMASSQGDGNVPRRDQVGLADGEGGRGPNGTTAEAQLQRARASALQQATHRNRGRPRRTARRSSRRR